MSIREQIEKNISFQQAGNKVLKLGIDRVPAQIKCPFHSDDTPSMKVYVDGLAYCFGCGKMYSSYDIIMRHVDYNIKEAIEYAEDTFGIKIDTGKSEKAENLSAKLVQELCNYVKNNKDSKDNYYILKYVKRAFREHKRHSKSS